MQGMRLRTALGVAALAAVATVPISSAGALPDETKPAESCYGKYFVDRAGDNKRGHPQFAGQDGTPNLDLIDGFFKFDAGKNETTVNIRVKELTKQVPQGSNSIQWQTEWTGKSGALTWVRAVTDFSGLVTYDYGGQEQAGVTTANVRQGGTTGAFFEGPDGIVQIVIPETVEPKGTVLKSIVTHAYEPVQAIPGAAPTPVKGGQLYEQDNATSREPFTIGAPCPATKPADPAPSPPATGAPGTGAQPTGGPVRTSEGPLPVKVLTKRAKRAKRLTIKLRASEPITKLAAQLVKGKKVLGKGKLAKLTRNGKLKLKTKKLKKGTYRLDLAGSDRKGARRFVSAKLKIR